jgi:DNA polymerase III subunit delta
MKEQIYSYSEFVEQRDKKTFPIYYLEGEDDFLLKEVFQVLQRKLLGSSVLEFNCSRFTGARDLKAVEIITACMELPVMAPLRLVYVQDIQKLPAEEKDRLAQFIGKEKSKTVLILSNNASASGKERGTVGKKLETVIREKGATVQCSMAEGEMEEWIINTMKKNGYEMRQDAAQHLRRRIGPDLWLISIEMSKLRAYCGPRKAIVRQDVEALSSYTPQAQIYQITEYIMKGNVDGTLKTFHELVAMTDPSVGTLYYINRFFINILESQRLVSQTGSTREAARTMKKSEYWVKKNLELASALNSASIQKIGEALMQADYGIKRGKDIMTLYEVLFIYLCSLFRKRDRMMSTFD